VSRFLRLWRQQPLLGSAFLLAVAVTLFFAASTVWNAVYWAMNREQPVSPWMTVGFVGRSWDVDPREIDRIAGLPLPEVKGRPQPLSEIAADRGVPVEDIILKVEAAIALIRAEEERQRSERKAGGQGSGGQGSGGQENGGPGAGGAGANP
jgi:uncharacterized membrane protein YgcG